MKIFKINEKIEAICQYKKTRYGFKHTAKLFLNGEEMGTAECYYSNRTWERYEYQSVLKKLEQMKGYLLSDKKRKMLKDFIKNYEDTEAMDSLRNVGMVAMLGDILAETQKDRNAWKLRMLKAGLGEGIILPDDFDTLPEKEKERRLNGAIGIITKREV